MSYFEALSAQNIADIHEASLEVLHKTGFVIEHKVALKKLSDAGARGNLESNVAHFSPGIYLRKPMILPRRGLFFLPAAR
jgi:trimethylamine:corrinoid methyltransferase-like protein